MRKAAGAGQIGDDESRHPGHRLHHASRVLTARLFKIEEDGSKTSRPQPLPNRGQHRVPLFGETSENQDCLRGDRVDGVLDLLVGRDQVYELGELQIIHHQVSLVTGGRDQVTLTGRASLDAALEVGEGLVGFQGVVDDQHVGAPPREDAPHRGMQHDLFAPHRPQQRARLVHLALAHGREVVDQRFEVGAGI